MGERRKGPGEGQRKVEVIRRFLVLRQPEDGVLEGEERPRVHLEGQMKVEGSPAPVFGMELYLPDLAERVGLDEVTFVVHVKAMIDRMILEVRYISGYVDDCHRWLSLPAPALLRYRRPMDDDALLEVLHAAASAVADALGDLNDWGLAGTREGQYRSDLAADAAALAVLDEAGLGVMSEESGPYRVDRDVVVVIDPVDGSTNASRRIPWYATSLCALDPEGPRAAVVVNQASGARFEAVRGAGARRDGVSIRPSKCETLNEAIIGFSGYPPRHLGWSQYRCLGAAALDLCAVAEGVLDGYTVVGGSQLGSWDYLGGMLICTEAGAVLGELNGRDLITLEHSHRRTPVAASTPALLRALCDAAAQ
jgi:myo-inositol-1(or 4)-monophosphatase